MSPKRFIIPVFIPHLGCHNDCVFCNQRKISGELKPATAKTVKAAVEEALKKIPEDRPAELAFYGGSFTAIPEHEQTELLEAAQPFIESGRVGEIRLSTRPDAVDLHCLERLKSYGVKTIELGAQSMDEGVLKASGRGHTAADTECASRLIKEHGFNLILQMMTGLPGDTEEKAMETVRKLASLSPDGVRVYPTVILRDTALYNLWKAGRYREHTVEDAVRLGAKLYEIFTGAGIPVIRFGLNPSDELSGGEAAGGAYHPALGELVRSEFYLNLARELISTSKHGGEIVLGVNRGCVSLMTGQKRRNINALMQEFNLKSVIVRETELPAGKFVIILQ
ncbi:MAG TPA: radical SAM protein [Clostridiales bacterium]|jgi:histone acetyltransferase (RNA polymerase elongator complex component)|nr:radical SAM protein [Clostridiales bacterium]